MGILNGGIIFLIGLSLGWLTAQYFMRRRLNKTIRKYQGLREVIQERTTRIQILQRKIHDRDVIIENMRSLINNHERMISELQELVKDRLALLRILEQDQNRWENRLKLIGSESSPITDQHSISPKETQAGDIEFDSYNQMGSGNVQAWEDALSEEDS